MNRVFALTGVICAVAFALLAVGSVLHAQESESGSYRPVTEERLVSPEPGIG